MDLPPSIEGSLPSPAEMRSAIDVVLAKCAEYVEGPHVDFIQDLAARLKETPEPVAKQGIVENEGLTARYLDAIASLVSRAFPPSVKELESTLSRINQLTRERITDVDFLEGSNDAREILSLRSTLAQPLHPLEEDRHVVESFRVQLPRTDWSRVERRQREGGENGQ